MNLGYFYFTKAIISLLIVAMINISLDLSYYSFRSSLSKPDSFSEIDVNSVTELVLELGLDWEDQEIEEEEDQPAKPPKPDIKLIPVPCFMKLIIPKMYAFVVFVSYSLNFYTSFFTQDSPPPRV